MTDLLPSFYADGDSIHTPAASAVIPAAWGVQSARNSDVIRAAFDDPWRTEWTPTVGGLTIGDGTITAIYRRVGPYVIAQAAVTLDSSTVTGAVTIDLPLPPYDDADRVIGIAAIFDESGAVLEQGLVVWAAGGTSAALVVEGGVVNATRPFTFADGDTITVSLDYEAAVTPAARLNDIDGAPYWIDTLDTVGGETVLEPRFDSRPGPAILEGAVTVTADATRPYISPVSSSQQITLTSRVPDHVTATEGAFTALIAMRIDAQAYAFRRLYSSESATGNGIGLLIEPSAGAGDYLIRLSVGGADDTVTLDSVSDFTYGELAVVGLVVADGVGQLYVHGTGLEGTLDYSTVGIITHAVAGRVLGPAVGYTSPTLGRFYAYADDFVEWDGTGRLLELAGLIAAGGYPTFGN